MKQVLQEIMLDFQELQLETGTSRRLKLETVPGKASVCIGVRRCGKSTYLFQIMEQLQKDGVQPENILYLNFFDDRLHALQHEDLGVILEAYFGLYPEKKSSQTVYCFFDEVQAVSNWEPFVDRLMRTEKCRVYLTGSSARMLSKEIATQMRGRALSWELFPFSFREFLDAKGIQSSGPLSAKKRLTIRKAFEDYWETGGFPEVIGLEKHLRLKIHQEYFQAVLFRDIVERYNISHPRAVTDLAHRLMDNIASLYTVNRLTGYLKSLGHKSPKAAVSDYLEWFEDAYFFFSVRIFDPSLSRSKTNPKKIYCIDHSLVTSVASGILINSGHLLENLIFMALRRLTSDIWYYKTASGLEVDFIAQLPDRSRRLIQVCETLSDEETRRRELRALAHALDELGLDSGTLVTRDHDEDIDLNGRRLQIISAWRFLLSLPEHGH
jgi:hypothetical protein